MKGNMTQTHHRARAVIPFVKSENHNRNDENREATFESKNRTFDCGFGNSICPFRTFDCDRATCFGAKQGLEDGEERRFWTAAIPVVASQHSIVAIVIAIVATEHRFVVLAITKSSNQHQETQWLQNIWCFDDFHGSDGP
jgi:hypothetical protein